ncbi:efflux RND transporter periplasmic adaptor subunit [Roseibium polysiphoniae]|uniref:Efflux RND transporter periplasmic adaptor subunit n=1 Tax=Roseibium polysiphoniae TaxID=2571221 RepID=A0A944GT73_9HYPH|nr:efflux RND transporter periplasmic adaptor subunit [Roseibium polysiphoniae]MBS8261578.1 efflux RND transporter periplasmic adaptor subunit [Roseibium polysiphoniae]
MLGRKNVILACALAIAAASSTAAFSQQKGPPPTVTVVTMQAEDVTLRANMPGRVVAYGVAEVRPQVSGIIVERLFKEGATVEKGDPMYRIDKAVYAATVAQARASVAQAQATLTSSEKELKRANELYQRNVVSQQSVDDATASRDAAQAGLLLAQAQLLSAEIDLEHTTISAPLSGIVGRTLTTQGALVTAQQAEPLAVIRQIDKVYVDVAASTADILRYNRSKLNGSLAQEAGGLDPEVTLTLADGLTYDHTGTMRAAEPQVDPQTGVSVMRLEFPNPEQLLLPGLYVKAHLPVELAKNVVLAPQEGISRDRRGQPTALIVNGENVVEQKTLEVLGTRDGNWIVADGLKAGDRLIVAGLQKIAPGVTVTAEERPAKNTLAQN